VTPEAEAFIDEIKTLMDTIRQLQNVIAELQRSAEAKQFSTKLTDEQLLAIGKPK